MSVPLRLAAQAACVCMVPKDLLYCWQLGSTSITGIANKRSEGTCGRMGVNVSGVSKVWHDCGKERGTIVFKKKKKSTHNPNFHKFLLNEAHHLCLSRKNLFILQNTHKETELE